MASRGPALPDLHDRSHFIFRGTLVRAGASNVRQIAGGQGTALVRVDEVLRGTGVTRGLVGQEVTVVFDAGEKSVPRTDEARVFFTNGLVFGENVAVRAVGHVEASPGVLGEVEELGQRAALKPLEERAASADAIVLGRVLGLQALEKLRGPRSEHDPDWWLARVLVLDVNRGKGAEAGQEVDVLFANSDDIAWRDAPKLHPGESGLLLLHRLDRKEAPPGVKGTVYRIIDPLDLLPIERLEDVKAALGRKAG